MQPPAGSFLALLPLIASVWTALILVSVAAGYATEAAMKERRVWALPLDAGQLRHEVIGNAVFLAIAIVTTTLFLARGWIRFSTPDAATTGRMVATFWGMWFGFQAYYYAAHRLMHRRELVRMHRWHHRSRVTTPLTGHSMSWAEALVWMVGYFGLPALVSVFVPLSFSGWLSYLVFNVFGNLVGHANVETVGPSRILWWRSTFGAVFTFHSLHHARWTGHYGFASTWADRLFKTEWNDWLDLHARVWRGEALTSFKQRGTPRDQAVPATEPAKGG
jgi:sterol desaturase/sphingolipid hydroxylase (fatty acid hydroxylase superfamily)